MRNDMNRLQMNYPDRAYTKTLGRDARHLQPHRSLRMLTIAPSCLGNTHTINPWISTDDRTLRKFEFSNLCLDAFIFESILLDHQDFLVVGITMNIGA